MPLVAYPTTSSASAAPVRVNVTTAAFGPPSEAGPLIATFTTGVDHILSGGAELSYGRKTRKA